MLWGYVPLCTRSKQKKTYFVGRQNGSTRVGLLYMYKKKLPEHKAGSKISI